MRALTLILLSSCFLSPALHSATVTFNFDSDPGGQFTPFTDTVSGLSATFSSFTDPGSFQVEATFLQSLTGQILLDPGPANLANIPLLINFSAPLYDISLNFATISGAGVPFYLDALRSLVPVGSVTSSGTVPAGQTYPEGLISFSGGPFDAVVLSSAAPFFAIDNITANTTPEPGAALLSVLALGLIALLRHRPSAA